MKQLVVVLSLLKVFAQAMFRDCVNCAIVCLQMMKNHFVNLS